MELGPGSGYFSAGFKFVFPKADITVIDINQRVIEFNREHHGYAGVCDFPDVKNEDFEGKFDLVIARDIIEHVNDISRVLNNVNRYLIPGGHFHFITPNGHEDVWKHYLTEIHTGLPSELLINHVNYFDGRGLAELLEATGFEMVDYYTYKLRTFLRGEGWSRNRKHMNPVSAKKNSAVIFGSEGKFSGTELAKARILDKWYINNRHKWITILFCYYQHFEIFRLNPSLNVGHEIYGLFRKR